MGNKLVVVVWWLAALSIACSEGYPLRSGPEGQPDDAAAAAFGCAADSDCESSFVEPVDDENHPAASCESMVGLTLIDSLETDALWAHELSDNLIVGDAGIDLSIPDARDMTAAFNWPAESGAWTRIMLQERRSLRLEFDDDDISARFMLLDKCADQPVEDDVLARGLGGIETGELEPGVYYLAAYADQAADLFASAHFIESESCGSLPVRTVDELSEPYQLTLQGQAGDFFVNDVGDPHRADVAISIEVPQSTGSFPATVELVFDASGNSFPYNLALLSDCETETELEPDEDWVLSEPITEFVPHGGAIYTGEYSTQVVLTAEIETAGVYHLVIKSDDDGRYNWGWISLTARIPY